MLTSNTKRAAGGRGSVRAESVAAPTGATRWIPTTLYVPVPQLSRESPLVSVMVCVVVHVKLSIELLVYFSHWHFTRRCGSPAVDFRDSDNSFRPEQRSTRPWGGRHGRVWIVHIFHFHLFHGDCRISPRSQAFVGSEVCASVRGRKNKQICNFYLFL